jgi:thiol-disulfide isomerase/thioredoxin
MSVINLTDKNFTIKSNGVYITKGDVQGTPGILLIWASWCPHCHHFLPKFNNLAKILGNNFKCVTIEHAELQNNPKLSDALDFKYFPTLKFFDQHGRIISEYSGPREINDILKHICEMYHHCIKYH